MNPDIHINYVLRYINRGATAAARAAQQSIKRDVDNSTRAITRQTRANEDNARSTRVSSRAVRDSSRTVSEHTRAASRNSREVDRQASSHRRLAGSVAQSNSRFMFLRNVISLIKWPALITGAGLAFQAIGALTGGVVALTAALAPLSGALIAYPAIIGTVVQAMGTFKLATGGISEVVKGMADEQLRGGITAQTMADQTRAAAEQVRTAERAVADAKRESRLAEEGLTAAREEAQRQLQSMRAQAAGAAIGEKQAANTLNDARRALEQARSDPDTRPTELRDLVLAEKDAEFQLAEAKRTRRWAEEDLQEAERKGIKGSEQMVQARRSIREAHEQEKDALRQLTEAQRANTEALNSSSSAADLLQARMNELPTSAQKFARYLFSLKPRLDDLRETAADGFLPGAQRGIQSAMRNLPVVDTIIGRMSRRMGRLAADTGDFLGRGGFGRDLQRIGGSNTRLMGNLGEATFHLADALRHVMVAGGPFINWMGRAVREMSGAVEESAKLNRRNGDTAEFFQRTKQVMRVTWDIAKNLGGAFIQIGRAGRPLGNDILRDLRDASREFRLWTESARGRNELREYFDDIQPGLYELGRLVRDVTKAFFTLSRQQGFVDMTRTLRTELLPVLVRIIGVTTRAFGPELIHAIAQIANVIGDLAGVTGPLRVFVRTISTLAGGFHWLLNNVPGIKAVVTAILSFAAVRKALTLTGVLPGLRRATSLMGGLAGATNATTVATERLTAAQVAQQRVASRGPGFVPWGQPIPGPHTTVPGAPGTAVPVGGVGGWQNTRATYQAARAVGQGRLGAMTTAGRIGGGMMMGNLARMAMPLGPIGLALGGLSFGQGFAQPIDRNQGMDERMQNGLSGLTFGLIPAVKSMAEIRQQGQAAAREAIRDGMTLKDLNQKIKENAKMAHAFQSDGEPGVVQSEIVQQLKGQNAEYERQARMLRRAEAAADVRRAQQLASGGRDSFQALFRTIVKGSGNAEKALDKTTKQMLNKMGNLRREGSGQLGQLYLDWAKQQAKHHPELRGRVNDLAGRMERRWHRMGREWFVINGDIFQGTTKEWDRLYDRLDNREERWRQNHHKRLTRAQRDFKDVLEATRDVHGPYLRLLTLMMSGEELSRKLARRADATTLGLTASTGMVPDWAEPRRRPGRPGGATGGYVAPGGIIPQGYAAGGLVAASDTVNAWLTPGEFVMRKEAVQRHGLPMMQSLNRGGVVGGLDPTAGMTKNYKRTSDETEKFVRRTQDQFKKLRNNLAERTKEMDDDNDRRFKNMRDKAERSTKTMERQVTGSVKEMRDEHQARLKDMDQATTTRMRSMVATSRDRGDDLVRSVRSSMGEADNAVYRGFTYITDATTKAMRAFDAKPIELTVPKPSTRKAMGGVVGMWGERGIDDQLVLMGRGEAVLTAHHQPVVDYAMQATYGVGLPDLFDQVQTPHYMARGGFKPTPTMPRFARGGKGPTKQGAVRDRNHQVPFNLMSNFDVMGSGEGFVPMMNFLNATVGSGKLVVISGLRPGSTVVGGGTSNHAYGNAVDIATPGIRYLSGTSNQLASAPAAEVAALDATNDYLAKYFAPPVGLDQLWRTAAGGGHWNHVHKGIAEAYAQNAEKMIDYIGTLPEGKGVGQMGIGKMPKVKGTKGPMRDIAQGAISQVFRAARKKVSQQSLRMGTGTGSIAGIKGGSVQAPGLPPALQKYNKTFPGAVFPSAEWNSLYQMPFDAVAALAQWAGGGRVPGVTMAQVSQGEGNLRPGSRSTDNGWGLWGITSPFADSYGVDKLGGYEGMLNPVANAIIMSRMYPSGWSGGSPWYGTGHVKGYDLHYSGKLLSGGGGGRRGSRKMRGGFAGGRAGMPLRRFAKGGSFQPMPPSNPQAIRQLRSPIPSLADLLQAQTAGYRKQIEAMREDGITKKEEGKIEGLRERIKESRKIVRDFIEDIATASTEQLRERMKSMQKQIKDLRVDGLTTRERTQLNQIKAEMRGVKAEIKFDRALKRFGDDVDRMGVNQIDNMQDRLEKQIKRLHRGGVTPRERAQINRIKEEMGVLDKELRERASELAKLVERAGMRTGLQEGALQEMELRQQLAGTYEQGGGERAAFITSNIIPRLERERELIEKQLRVAEAQGNTTLALQFKQALQETTNQILQQQLEAQNLIKENTQAAAESLAEYGGQLAFEYGGQRMTDQLVNVGLGT